MHLPRTVSCDYANSRLSTVFIVSACRCSTRFSCGRPLCAATGSRITLAAIGCVRGWSERGQSARRCSGPKQIFGILFGELFKLMKRIDVDHELARELWATGNVDARNLAMKIADPLAMTPDEFDRWAIENPMPMCSLYVAKLAVECLHARGNHASG